MNIILFFTVFGFIAFVIIASILMREAFAPKEAPRQSFIDVNDLPNWQPMTPIQKRSNEVLKQMYKGRAINEQF